ncbi:MAG TPA: hypothetical protein VNZ61_25345 [Roseomonas sp.]|nr:hypothetical protein [Roseomonas sp.]
MAATEPRAPGATDADKTRDKKKTEQQLEKGLEDTFPASDPPSISDPSKSVGWEKENSDKD